MVIVKFIYIAGGDFQVAFTSGKVIEDKFFLRPFFDWNATTTNFLRNLQKGFALSQQITDREPYSL